MALNGNTLRYMPIHGNTWQYTPIHGNTCLFGYTWQHMVIHGNTWGYTVNTLLHIVIQITIWQYVFILFYNYDTL